MTYATLNMIFCLPIAVLAFVAWAKRRDSLPSPGAYLVTALVVVVDTAIFDNVLIALHIVDYNPGLILGAKIWLAPVEDFAYAIGACVLLPALWVLVPSARTGTREHTDTLSAH